MRVSRQTETELIVEESSLWITILLALASLPLFYVATFAGKRGNLLTACFLLICSLVWLRQSRFVFDAAQRVVRWNRLRFFKSSSGVIPFAEITGINTESTCGRSGGSRIYRLTIATTQGCIPMSDSYEPGRATYAAIRETILRFLGSGLSGDTQQPRALTK